MRSLQTFAFVHASVCNHFNPERRLSSRANLKLNRAAALAEWRGLCAGWSSGDLPVLRLVRLCLAAPAACAQSPNAIAPVSMGNAFTSVPCNQARSMMAQERQTLAALETKQRSAVTGDAVGVFLIGVPVSSLTGNDVAGFIGASKGKVIALENRLMTCG